MIILRRRKRKTLVHLFRIIFMFFAGLFVAAVISLAQLDINTLKESIVATLKNSTGLPVEIKGALSWKLSLQPMIMIKDVRIKNAPWANHKYAFQMPEMLVQINLVSLLRRAPTIQMVRMIRPVANIERNAKGKLSIELPERTVTIPQVMPKNDFPFDLDFGIGSLELVGPQIFLIDDDSVASWTPDRVKISLSQKDDTLDFTGFLLEKGGNYPFILSFAKYNEKKGTYSVRLAVAGDVIPMSADVVLNGATKMPVDLTMNGFVENMPVFGNSIGLNLPQTARAGISLSASLRKKNVVVKKFLIKTNESDILISGIYDFSSKKPKINAKVKSDNFDLAEFFPTLYGNRYKWPRPNRPLNVFKDIPLFGEFLPMFNMDADFEIGAIRVYRQMTIRNVMAGFHSKDGRAVVDLDADFATGRVRSKTRIREEDGGMLRVASAGTGRGILVGNILSSVNEDGYISDLPMNFDFYLRGHGYELSDIAGSVTGLALASSDSGGYAHEELIEFLYGRDFLTSLRDSVAGIFNSRKKNDQMRIHCAVANLKIRNGMFDMDKNVVVQTKAVNIRMIGNMDLGRETMNVSMDTVPTQGIKLSLTGNVVKSLELSGNLAEPELKLNRSAALNKIVTATAIGLAVGALTGGIGLLVGAGVGLVSGDVVDNWSADEKPCRTALAGGAPPSRRGDPDFMKMPVARLAADSMME